MLNYKEWKNEDLLVEQFIINENKPYGQAILLVGGSGSGKDFVTEKLAIANYKMYKKFSSDTVLEFLPKSTKFQEMVSYVSHELLSVLNDKPLKNKQHEKDIKEWLEESVPTVFSKEELIHFLKVELPQEINTNLLKVKEKGNLSKIKTISLIDVKSGKNVAFLRVLMYIYKTDEKFINNFINVSSKTNSQNLPNVSIEFIGKISSFKNKLALLEKAGYQKENISVVWILTKREIAQKNNKLRPRSLNPDIIEHTHTVAATNLSIFLKHVQDYIDGEFWIVLNSSILNQFKLEDDSEVDAKTQFKVWLNKTKSYKVDKLDENVTSVKVKSKNKKLFEDFHSLIDITGFKKIVNLFADSEVFKINS